MCLLAQPENLQTLEQSDPAVANLLKKLNSEEHKNEHGPMTAEMLYKELEELNVSPQRQPYHKQLVIIFEKQVFQVPQFSFPGE